MLSARRLGDDADVVRRRQGGQGGAELPEGLGGGGGGQRDVDQGDQAGGQVGVGAGDVLVDVEAQRHRRRTGQDGGGGDGVPRCLGLVVALPAGGQHVAGGVVPHQPGAGHAILGRGVDVGPRRRDPMSRDDRDWLGGEVVRHAGHAGVAELQPVAAVHRGEGHGSDPAPPAEIPGRVLDQVDELASDRVAAHVAAQRERQIRGDRHPREGRSPARLQRALRDLQGAGSTLWRRSGDPGERGIGAYPAARVRLEGAVGDEVGVDGSAELGGGRRSCRRDVAEPEEQTCARGRGPVRLEEVESEPRRGGGRRHGDRRIADPCTGPECRRLSGGRQGRAAPVVELEACLGDARPAGSGQDHVPGRRDVSARRDGEVFARQVLRASARGVDERGREAARGDVALHARASDRREPAPAAEIPGRVLDEVDELTGDRVALDVEPQALGSLDLRHASFLTPTFPAASSESE
jgi:hypothetical protein